MPIDPQTQAEAQAGMVRLSEPLAAIRDVPLDEIPPIHLHNVLRRISAPQTEKTIFTSAL